jgi:hypothetical protein
MWAERGEEEWNGGSGGNGGGPAENRNHSRELLGALLGFGSFSNSYSNSSAGGRPDAMTLVEVIQGAVRFAGLVGSGAR